MNTHNLHSTTEYILEACKPHIVKAEFNNEKDSYDRLWLLRRTPLSKTCEEVYLALSHPKSNDGNEICRCIVYKVVNGTRAVLTDLSSFASNTAANAVSYIKCLSKFVSERASTTPNNLLEGIVEHIAVDRPSLILLGGELGTGKTTTALAVADYVINNGLYHCDNVLVLNNQEDFSVLLENISAGRTKESSLVVFDELRDSGDMFAVSTLLDANCTVIIVTPSVTFSDMIHYILSGLEGHNLRVIIEEVKTHLNYMVLHAVGDKNGVVVNNHVTLTAPKARGLNLFDVIMLNGEPLHVA